jgi:hypothetical protein
MWRFEPGRIAWSFIPIVLATAVPSGVSAATVTYSFAGVMSFDGPGPIVKGMPFSGSFTLDLSTPGQPSNLLPDTTDYFQKVPPASFSFAVDGLTIGTPDVALVEILADDQDFSLYIQTHTLAGTGWSFTPSGAFPTYTGVTLNFQFAPNTLTDLADLPDLRLTRSLPTSPKSESISFQAGDYAYPGGSFSTGGLETHFSITSLTLVPEPSNVVLVALAVGGLLIGARGVRASKP